MSTKLEKAPIYISVVGPHYAGKSTLCEKFITRLNFVQISENWQDDPYRTGKGEPDDYYKAQYWYFLKKSQAMIEADQVKGSGKSVILDTLVFSTLTFAKTKLDQRDYLVYSNLINLLGARLPLPDLLIYLHADTDYLYSVNRSRRIESKLGPDSDATISRNWLNTIVMNNLEIFDNWDLTPMIKIDVETTNIQSDEGFDSILEQINQTL